MPGIDLKQMWATVRLKILAVWKFFSDWLSDPFEAVQRGLVGSGILRASSPQSIPGLLWATFVWIPLLPLVMIGWGASFLVVLPFSLAWGVLRLLAWPFTGRWEEVRAPVASRMTEMGDTLRVFSQQTWPRRLLSLSKGIGDDLLTSAIGFASLFGFICLIWIGIFFWWGAILASSHLFGYGFFNGRDDASAGINSFTITCHYRNLTQRDMISMTFDTRAARDAFSCPAFKRMGKSKP